MDVACIRKLVHAKRVCRLPINTDAYINTSSWLYYHITADIPLLIKGHGKLQGRL